MATMRDRMIRGQLYDASDPELCDLRLRGQRVCRAYNALDDDAQPERARILQGFLGAIGQRTVVQSGVRIEYGFNVSIGSGCYVNYDVIFLDICPITIGDRVQIAPRVQLVTATHPLDPAERAKGPESGAPIRIGDDVWLGAGVIVLPGVTIGEGTTVASGAVVAKDLPPRVLAGGVPAKVIREL